MGRFPIKASGIRVLVALTVCALVLSAPALADDRAATSELPSPHGGPSPPDDASQQIGMSCFAINVVIVSHHKCQSPDPAFNEHCFEGLGLGTPELGLFALFRSDGDLYVVDNQIFSNTSTFQFNYAVAYSNINYFANLTHRLGSFHGAALGLGTVASGGGLGKWSNVSDVPGRQCGRLGRSADRSGSASPRSPSSRPGRAGHRSPTKAIAGFVKGFNRDDAREACGYTTPSLRKKCLSAFERFGAVRLRVRDLKVASSRRKGTRASVKVKGTGCLDSRCEPLRGESGEPKTIVKCKRVGGKWYVR